MIRNHTKYISFLTLWVLFIPMKKIFGQEEKIVKEVQVVKPYEPTISDAFKINRLPKISDTVKVVPRVTYSVNPHPYSTAIDIRPIKPARMVGEPLQKLYNGYVNIGVGTKLTPLLEAYIQNKRSEDYLIGSYLKYYSSYAKTTLDDDSRVYAGFSDIDYKAYGKKFFENAVLSGDLGVINKKIYQYGYNTDIDTSLNKEDIIQKYILFDVNAGYKSMYLDSSHINYDFKLGYDYLKDDYDHTESMIKVNVRLDKYFVAEMGGIDLDIYHIMKNEELDSVNNTVISISPWIGIFGEKWKVKAGINVFSDLHGESSNTYYYPTGYLEYDVVNHFIIPYFGVDGKLDINSYQNTLAKNPFITPGLTVQNTDNSLILHGGLKGNLSKSTYYNLNVRYTITENMPLFVNDYTATNSIGNTFDVKYDEVEHIRYYGEFSYRPGTEFSFSLKGSYNQYQTNDEDYAWHMPDFNLDFYAKYNLRNKIILDANLNVIGNRYAELIDGTAEKLNPSIDLNIGIVYNYSKVLSGFIHFNNILSSENYLWHYYPSYGFNFTAGVSYSF